MAKSLRLVAGERSRSIRLLGPCGVSSGGAELDISGWQRRPLTLLRLLAAHGGKVARDTVIDLLWPDSAPEAGGTNLRGLLHRLRQYLGDDPPPVLIQGSWVMLNPALDWEIDLAEFEDAVARAGDEVTVLQGALARYTGEPLAEDRYEDWAAPIRERAQRTYREGVLRLAELLRAQAEPGRAIAWLERLLAADPLDETVFCHLLAALSEDRRRGDIRRELAGFAKRLKAELDVEPEEETMRLARRLMEAPSDDVTAAPTDTSPGIRSVLPSLLTPFIGRTRETEGVVRLLAREGVRLVTLTGPGGSGKTRLAIEVAGRMADGFPDGVCFVNLAPLAAVDLVAPTIVAALQLPRSPAPALQRLIGRLRDARFLLVLDNFEHVLESATVVSELLEHCRHLQILVTSREILRLRAEYQYSVPPLALPPDEAGAHGLTGAGIEQYDSIAFFVDRATAARPDFTLTAENARAVAGICRRLDGIPLALELAAARIRMFPPERLLERLDRRLAVLTGGPRDLPDRQQTLRAAIDWSYHLLTDAERTLLARLSIFAGGWTIESAEAVCNVEEDIDVFACLTSLFEKSIVRQEEAGSFMMLETLREYAGERLSERAERDVIRAQHAAWVASMVGAEEPEPAGRPSWYRRLDTVVNDLRSALEWARESGLPEFGLRLLNITRWYWIMRGWAAERQRQYEATLALGGPIDRQVLARALLVTGGSKFGPGPAMLEEAARLARELGDIGLEAECLRDLAAETASKDLEQAEALAREALLLSEKVGDRLSTAVTLDLVALIRAARGDLQSALALEEQAVGLVVETRDDHQRTRMLSNLSNFAMRSGDVPRARQCLLEALAHAEPAGYEGAPVYIVETGAAVAVMSGEVELGARLTGAAQAARIPLGWGPDQDERIAIEMATAHGSATLGLESWHREVEVGRSLTSIDCARMLKEFCEARIFPARSYRGSSSFEA